MSVAVINVTITKRAAGPRVFANPKRNHRSQWAKQIVKMRFRYTKIKIPDIQRRSHTNTIITRHPVHNLLLLWWWRRRRRRRRSHRSHLSLHLNLRHYLLPFPFALFGIFFFLPSFFFKNWLWRTTIKQYNTKKQNKFFNFLFKFFGQK